jgi:hypothetical protein
LRFHPSNGSKSAIGRLSGYCIVPLYLFSVPQDDYPVARPNLAEYVRDADKAVSIEQVSQKL